MRITDKVDDQRAPENDRRRGTREALARMVQERTKVLSLYWRLAGIDSFSDPEQREPAQKLLQEFCQLLVDYIAVGHFCLYERIVNGTERRREIAALAHELYPRIADTTSVALDFNDKYDCTKPVDFDDVFKRDLSRLGEELAVRIELEDRLIARMLR
ncbi:MAG TPA: Rsd/AlgQ family anti-sigma factor [Burkholderiales bacterium]